MSTASGKSVFKLGEESRNNREAIIIGDTYTYDVDYATFTTYTDQSVRFPYLVE